MAGASGRRKGMSKVPAEREWPPGKIQAVPFGWPYQDLMNHRQELEINPKTVRSKQV